MSYSKKLIVSLFGKKQPYHPKYLQNIRSILVRPLGYAIGDALMHAAHMQQLKAVYPNARTGIFVSQRNQDIFRYLPQFDEILPVKKFSLPCSQRHRWDMMLDFYEAFTSADIIRNYIISPKVCIIFNKRDKPIYNLNTLKNYDHHFSYISGSHFISRLQHPDLLKLLNLPEPVLTMHVPNQDIQEASKSWIPNNNRIKILLAPFGSRTERTLPASEIAEIFCKLNIQYQKKICILLANTPESESYYKNLKQLLPAEIMFILSDKISLSEYVALTASADLVMAVDSGSVHIASALEKPLMAFYANNPENIQLWHPFVKTQTPCLTLISRESAPNKQTVNFDTFQAANWLNCQIAAILQQTAY